MSAGNVRPAAVARVAAAAAELAADETADERLAGLASHMFAWPHAGSAPAGGGLPGTREFLAGLDRAVEAYEQAAGRLSALATEPVPHDDASAAETSAADVTAALRAVSELPADVGPDGLAAAIGGSAAPAVAAATPDPVTSSRAALARAADQHAAAQAALAAELDRLGLSGQWQDLKQWPDYAHQRDVCDQRVSRLGQDLARQVRARWDREAAVLAARLADRRAALGQEQAQDLVAPVQQLVRATEDYANCVRTELRDGTADAAATLSLLDALPDRLSHETGLLADGQLAAALAELAAAPVPLASSWPASQPYETAWAQLAGRLDGFVGQHRRRTAREGSVIGTELRRCAAGVGAAAGDGLRRWSSGRDAAWAEVQTSAAQLKRGAAELLLAPGPADQSVEPLRAAVTVMQMDQVAAANAATIVRDAFPVVPGKVLASDVAEDHLSATEKIVTQLGRNTVALSGLDGVLAPLLAASDHLTGPGLAVAMAELTPIPAELGRAVGDAAIFARDPLSGITPSGMVHGVVNHVEQNLVPHLGPVVTDHGFLGLAASAAKVPSELHGNLLVMMMGDDAPLLAAAKFAGGAVKSAYLHDVATMPVVRAGQQQLETAAHHAGHAAVAAAPDVLHGLLAHVPFVTIALSTTREIRLYQRDMTTLDQSVKNIVIDTASVATGLAAGEVAAHFVLGAHSAFLTVPFTIAGSLAARKIAKSIKQRPYREAVTRYAEVESEYSGKALELSRQLSAATRDAVAQQRSGYLAVVGQPPAIAAAAAAELATLVATLRAATAAYVAMVTAVLESSAPPAGAARTGSSAGAGPLLAARMARALRDCDQALETERYAEALMVLATMSLPVPETWRPSRQYRARCAAAAARISGLSEAQREIMARWAVEAAREFRDRNDKVAAIITRKAGAIGQERAAAETALQEAADDVQRTAMALGLTRPEPES